MASKGITEIRSLAARDRGRIIGTRHSISRSSSQSSSSLHITTHSATHVDSTTHWYLQSSIKTSSNQILRLTLVSSQRPKIVTFATKPLQGLNVAKQRAFSSGFGFIDRIASQLTGKSVAQPRMPARLPMETWVFHLKQGLREEEYQEMRHTMNEIAQEAMNFARKQVEQMEAISDCANGTTPPARNSLYDLTPAHVLDDRLRTVYYTWDTTPNVTMAYFPGFVTKEPKLPSSVLISVPLPTTSDIERVRADLEARYPGSIRAVRPITPAFNLLTDGYLTSLTPGTSPLQTADWLIYLKDGLKDETYMDFKHSMEDIAEDEMRLARKRMARSHVEFESPATFDSLDMSANVTLVHVPHLAHMLPSGVVLGVSLPTISGRDSVEAEFISKSALVELEAEHPGKVVDVLYPHAYRMPKGPGEGPIFSDTVPMKSCMFDLKVGLDKRQYREMKRSMQDIIYEELGYTQEAGVTLMYRPKLVEEDCVAGKLRSYAKLVMILPIDSDVKFFQAKLDAVHPGIIQEVCPDIHWYDVFDCLETPERDDAHDGYEAYSAADMRAARLATEHSQGGSLAPAFTQDLDEEAAETMMPSQNNSTIYSVDIEYGTTVSARREVEQDISRIIRAACPDHESQSDPIVRKIKMTGALFLWIRVPRAVEDQVTSEIRTLQAVSDVRAL